MKLFLFVGNDNDKVEIETAKRLDREFIFMVDSIHGNDRFWLETNFGQIPHQVYYGHRVNGRSVDGNHPYMSNSIFTVEERFTPLLVVSFHQGEVIERKTRDELKKYFMKLLFDSGEGSDDVVMNFLLYDCRINYQQPMEGSSVIGPEKQVMVEGAKCYDFRYKLYPGFDICLAEIVKPFVDRPYTIVLRNFEENGWKFLFSSIFFANSWGLCNEDFEFLKVLYEKLEMPGECDLGKMLKEHTEKCTPGCFGEGVMCEPEIYRKTLEETVGILKRKKCHEIEMEDQGDVKKKRIEIGFDQEGDEIKTIE